MSLASIREQIKVIVSGVSGIGVVHDHERFSNDWNKFLSLFKDKDGKINGCMFHREKCPKNQNTQGEYEKAHVFVCRKFMGLKDDEDTGTAFDEHLENVMDAFDTDAAETLNDACRTINPDWGPMSGAMGMQLDVSEIRMFGGVLCHYAELRLCAIEPVEI
ncbi:MAG: hypothetical protein WC374_04215 [Phycisphaerae bacterium]|jgi:hypothetical protein